MYILFSVIMTIVIIVCLLGIIAEKDKSLRDKLMTTLCLAIIMFAVITYLSMIAPYKW